MAKPLRNSATIEKTKKGSRKSAKRYLKPIVLTNTPLDWYKLTETTRFVLNSVIIESTKALAKEHAKINPDTKKIGRYQKLRVDAATLSRTSVNFESKERMSDILKTYGKINIR